MTVLEDVEEIIPPPTELRGPRESWELAKSILELEFPPTFRSFMDRYGEGVLGAELRFSDPCQPILFWEGCEFIQTHMREEQATYGYPWPGFPAPGRPSWQSVASNGNGDMIGFVVDADGVASEDSVWIVNLRAEKFLDLRGPFIELIHDLLTRTGRFLQVDQAFLAEEPENSVWRLAPEWY